MVNDLRYAFRAVLRAPAFVLLGACTLALGIGANTAIFSVINGVLLKPLPYRDADRIARLSEGRRGFELNVSYPNFLDWRMRSRTFEDMAVYNPYGRAIVATGGQAESVAAGTAESRLFTLLGVQPIRGRLFTHEEESKGNAVLISYRLWHRRFGGSDAVIGQSLNIWAAPSTVVGVLPAWFRLQNIDVWSPLPATIGPMQLDRANHPGLQLSHVSLMDRLRQAGSLSARGTRLRRTLITIEVALSLSLLVAAGLMLRTLGRLSAVDPGYRPQGLLAVSTQQPGSAYAEETARRSFATRVIDELGTAPGVSGAALAWPLDQVGISWSPYANFPDKPFPAGREPAVQMATVTPTYFETMGIPMRRGRALDERDREGTSTIAVVNETVVRRFLPPGDPIGRHVMIVGVPELRDLEIVGVVGDTLRGGLAGRTTAEVYCAYAQFPAASPALVVRAAQGDPLSSRERSKRASRPWILPSRPTARHGLPMPLPTRLATAGCSRNCSRCSPRWHWG